MSWICLWLSVLSALVGHGLSQCYTNSDCTGSIVSANDQKDCCVNNNNGLSFDAGGTCTRCIVHGFLQATYSVMEDSRLNTVFQLNVKGLTSNENLILSGTITAIADGTASSLDFEPIAPIVTSESTTNIRLVPIPDKVSLEYDDRVMLVFTPDISGLISLIESLGEYIRDTATVSIIDNDELQIFFEDCEYRATEGSSLTRPLRLKYYGPVQQAFTLQLRTVSIASAETLGLNDFIGSGGISTAERAIEVADFTASTTVVTVPVGSQIPGVETITVPQFFTVVDDNINEIDQIFALVVELGVDVPRNGCFLLQPGATDCSRKRGATRIIIKDNDPMVIGFTQRNRNVSESSTQSDFFSINIGYSALRTSEQVYDVTLRLNEQRSNATVDEHNLNSDAVFGTRFFPTEPLSIVTILLPGDTTNNLFMEIINDFRIEPLECFTLEIFFTHFPLGVREPRATCNMDSDATNFFCEQTICIEDNDEPFQVGFVQTTYIVLESAGSVEVCVQLTRPTTDILDETVRVEVVDHSTSVYIPDGASLATPDPPDFLGRYTMSAGTDYSQQTLFSNGIDDHLITELSRTICYNQTIYDDTLVEGLEYLGLSLAASIPGGTQQPTLRLMYDQAAILILDNDGRMNISKRLTYESTDTQLGDDVNKKTSLTRTERGVSTIFSTCYARSDCSGSTVPATSARECCVGTEEGSSYSSGSTCTVCVVHGFTRVSYNVEEGSRMVVSFRLNVKGVTQFGSQLNLFGTVTSEAGGTASLSDYDPISLTNVSDPAVITVTAREDFLTLEYDDSIMLMFTHSTSGFKSSLEALGEFLRDTATVNIIDNDLLQINFDHEGCDYATITEGATRTDSQIKLEFRRNQQPFTITFTSTSITAANQLRVGNFNVSNALQATAGADFTTRSTLVTIPANSQTYTVPMFYDVIDDNIDEEEQRFALIALIGQDVPENVSCFQTTPGSTGCLGRRWATEIRITDNDTMVIGFSQRSRTISEGSGPPSVDSFLIPIRLEVLRTSEREQDITIRLVESITNATVVGNDNIRNDFDAVFGSLFTYIQQNIRLDPLQSVIPPILMSIRNDFVSEPPECLTLRIQADDVIGRADPFICNEDGTNATNYSCEFTLCITDEDEPFEVAFVQTSYTVLESVGAVNICVNLTQPRVDILDETVNVFVIDFPDSTSIPAGAQATPESPDFLGRYFMRAGTDYAEQTLAINEIDDRIIDELNRIVCYNQTIYDDTLMESNEYFSLTLGVEDNQFTTVLTFVNQTFDQVTILIVDDDTDGTLPTPTPVTVGFAVSTYTTSETQGTVTISLTVMDPSAGTPVPFSLSLSTVNGTAVSGLDFMGVVQQTVQFNIGDTTRSINIFINDDTICEGSNEFFFINANLVSSNMALIIVVPPQVIVAINDINEPECVPTLSLSSESYTVGEADGSVTVCVNFSIPSTFVLDFTVTARDIGNATDGVDFTAGTRSGLLSRGSTQSCVSIPILDDNIPLEGEETFQVQLAPTFLPIPVDISTAVVTITDDDIFTCSATGVSAVTVACPEIESNIPLQCSFGGGPLHACDVPLVITRNVSPPGRHSVRILLPNGEDTTVAYSITDAKTNVAAKVPELQVVLSRGSPRVIGRSTIEAEFVTTRPVYSVTCFLRHPTGRDYKNCSSGSVVFSGLRPGRYILKIFARNRQTDFASVKMAVTL